MEIQKRNKISKLDILQILIIVIGSIFILIPAFHTNLWFDEAYSVGMANFNFAEIWQIRSADVHPILYYCMLHILYLIFGSNIYVYRIFSAIPLILLSILGMTEINKTFGQKVGILFSFFTLFLPISCVYACEIRMYTWGMLFVFLACLYAYKILQNATRDEINLKNYIIFTIFSLLSCNTHYYGVATAGVINLMLFIYLLVKWKKGQKEIEENNGKKDKKEKEEKNEINLKQLKTYVTCAIIQILIYLPWMVVMFKQISSVSEGFWIPKPTFDSLKEIFAFQFTGNLGTVFVDYNIASIFGLILTLYSMHIAIRLWKTNFGKESKDIKTTEENTETKLKLLAGYLSILVYAIVFIAMLLISFKQPILYSRYLLNITGLVIFYLAFFTSYGKKYVVTAICIITLLVACYVNYSLCFVNYADDNKQIYEFLEENMEDNDIILFDNDGGGFVLITQFPQTSKYFLDLDKWRVEDAYRAFGDDLNYVYDLEDLKDYTGRIWVVDDPQNKDLLEEVTKSLENLNVHETQEFKTSYHAYEYSLTLVEKE